MGRRLCGLLLLTCPWGLSSHTVLAFSMTAPAMTVSPLGNGLSSCLHSSCMMEASRSPGPAAAASTSPGSSSKSFPGPGGRALSVQSLFHGGDAGPGPGRWGPQGSPWAVHLCVQLCCALEDEQEEKFWAPEQGGVSTADREAVFLWSQEDAGSRGWPVGILQDGWPASQLNETRQRGAKIEGFFFFSFLCC